MSSPFRSPMFRRLWYTSLATTAAQGVERTVTAWLAVETGGDAVAVGLIFAARMLPSLLFGLAAGTIADRVSRTRQLQAVAAGAMLLMAVWGVLISMGDTQVWQVVLFSFVAGCIQVFDTPARQTLLLDTVPRESALRALSLNSLAGRCAVAVGALAAGALIPLAGVARCYGIVAAAYGIALLISMALRVPSQTHAVAPPPFHHALRDAARLLVDVPAVRTLLIAGMACEIFAFSHGSALPLFAHDVLAAGAEGLGTLNAAVSVGGAVAVTLLTLLSPQVRRQPVLGAIFLLYGLSLIALAGTHTLLAAAAVLLITGCCAGAFDVLQQTLMQMAVPDAQRGRAVGVWVLGLGSAPVGSIEMGLLIAWAGAPAALAINGAVTLAAAAIFLARAPEYRVPWRTRSEPR